MSFRRVSLSNFVQIRAVLNKPNFSGVDCREPASDQFSFLFVRAFGLHNHLHGDPWVKGHVYYFNQDGELLRNAWNSDVSKFIDSLICVLCIY